MAFSSGMGAEVQRPLATVVIGGVCSAMLMSLLVLRVRMWLPSRKRRNQSERTADEETDSSNERISTHREMASID